MSANIDAVLARLGEMNNGEINYEVYRELHDLVSAIEDDVQAPIELAQLMAERDAGKQAEADRAYLYQLGLKLGAERDAALAAIERVRAIHVRHKDTHKPDPSVINGNWFCCGAVQLGAVDPYACTACDSPEWPCPTLAALDGAPEPEWEYGCAWDDGATQMAFPVEAAAHLRKYPEPNGRLVRRRPVGPWLPVEGEKP